MSSELETEIKSWLETALKKENLKTLNVNILGNSEKGDGYLGDILFVEVTGTTNEETKKEYNLVLKCSKRSQVLRDRFPVSAVFHNEIFIYEKLFPTFLKYQEERNVEKPFSSYPKCYGSFTGENMEVIVLEDLKKAGYELWPKKEPLSRKLIDLVVTEYGKYHATSASMREQEPEKFQQLSSVCEVFQNVFARTPTMTNMFVSVLEESYQLLKNEIDEKVLAKWKNLQKDIDYVFKELPVNNKGLKVILHGDCWTNNFMYLFDKGLPLKVAILDWQVARYNSPVMDLSYFLFTCISETDLENLDDVLSIYHNSFVDQLHSLGHQSPESIYPFDKFMEDWKTYCKHGILMCSLIMKIVSTDKDEVSDIVDLAESGKKIADTFKNEIRDKESFKKRLKPLIEYVVKNNLI